MQLDDRVGFLCNVGAGLLSLERRPDLVLSRVAICLALHINIVSLPGGHPELDRVVHSVIGVEAVSLNRSVTRVVDINTEVTVGCIGGDMLQEDPHRVRRGRDLVVVFRMIIPPSRCALSVVPAPLADVPGPCADALCTAEGVVLLQLIILSPKARLQLIAVARVAAGATNLGCAAPGCRNFPG